MYINLKLKNNSNLYYTYLYVPYCSDTPFNSLGLLVFEELSFEYFITTINLSSSIYITRCNVSLSIYAIVIDMGCSSLQIIVQKLLSECLDNFKNIYGPCAIYQTKSSTPLITCIDCSFTAKKTKQLYILVLLLESH